jgi:SpoVK/Ycf46/Vps4 family AAA+-type ATPase
MSSDEYKELNRILQSGINSRPKVAARRRPRLLVDDIPESEDGNPAAQGMCQFSSNDGTRFFPASHTSPTLKPGIYEIYCCSTRGIYFQKIDVKTDDLIRFPETNSEKVIEEIKTFWDREEFFRKYDLSYKRGIILWGPAGSGKSCTIKLVSQDVVERGGVVFKFTTPNLFCEGVRIFREIQPDTPIVVLMEDLDSTVDCYSESEVLNILDGVDQIDKVVYLATTNYPERLGGRILNRPSRFDRRHKMGHPMKKSRKVYFEHLIDEETREQFNIDIDQWVSDTKKMSVAHLKELFTSVCILGNSYEEAVKILRTMVEEKPKSSEDEMASFGFRPGDDDE